jgi:hypothetical protein
MFCKRYLRAHIKYSALRLGTHGRGTHVLKAVDKPTIRPITELTHHVFDRYEVLDIDRWSVFEAVRCCGRIEVYKMTGTPGGLKVCHK